MKWLEKAQAHERANRLEEAEAVIRDAIPDPHFALEIAQLYADRQCRLRESGDVAGASVAGKQAEQWAYFFAAQATSGGEGRAFEVERDAFLKHLQR